MTRPDARLLSFAVLLAACSRGSRPADDGPLAPVTAAGIPSAATSARVVTPESTPASANLPALGALGTGGGSSGGGHIPPHVHDDGATVSSAALPSEVIRRIVRQNFGRFRLCYENGLRTDPTLTGSVRTRFVIEPDGAVGTVSDAGSIMSDAGVLACVQRAFGGLAFPMPAGGVSMNVTYALSFTAS